jgi:hypothetical protein
MSRIKKLENIYQEQLKDHQVDNVSDFIQFILDVDITKGKYARFLIESFLNDKFLEEDLIGGVDSTVGQAIRLFDKHKSKLPINERSVYALDKETGEKLYQSPGDLWNSVKQFQGELSGKELKREEQEKIYRETEFVYKDEETGFQIVSPLTEDSAKWWGKGTRWCTSAENNNRFEHYAKQAPLLILLMPDKQKLQFWKNDNNIQFMDEADKTVSLNYIEQNWAVLEPICLWLNNIQYIPKKYLTLNICKNIIQQNGDTLRYVPDEFKTLEICELAIKQSGEALGIISQKLRIKELCKLAVQQNGSILCYILKELRTPELCEIAVQSKGSSLGYVPEELKTKELCELAVKQDESALRYVPMKFRTEEIFELPMDKYQKIFQEIKTLFPIKDISLDYHH